MRTWLLFVLIVIAAHAVLLAIAYSFPEASTTAFFIGTPIIVIGGGLGAKFVQELRRRDRARQR